MTHPTVVPAARQVPPRGQDQRFRVFSADAPAKKAGTMPALSQTTSLLLWVHWIQFAAERIALLGSGLFAGAQLYRSLYAHPRQLRAGIAGTLRGFRGDTRPADGMLAGVAAATALAAMLACLGGTGVMWLVAGIADYTCDSVENQCLSYLPIDSTLLACACLLVRQ
jgi:hypothetical protein